MKGTICHCQTTPDMKDSSQLTLNIPLDLLKRLTEAAALDKTDVHALIICYLQQSLEDSSAELKRQQFLTHAKDVLEKHGVHNKTIEEAIGLF